MESKCGFLLTNSFKLLIDIILMESGTEDDDAAVIEHLITAINGFERIKPVRILKYFEITVPALTDKQFQQHFRLTRNVVITIENLIGNLLTAKPSSKKKNVDIRKQILMTIWLLATPDSFR